MSCTCGCGGSSGAWRSGQHGNRPWLSSIDYRLGTYATFREALLDELARTPQLARLRSRISDDYSVAMTEMWSAVADVVTFYTERIANEAFLRTATSRDSMLRLVRVLGYEPARGVAATSRLAVTAEPGTTVTVPPGTRVQSVPAEAEQPQKYETLQLLVADARLNRLRVFPAPVPVAPTGRSATRGVAAPDDAAVRTVAGLSPGNQVLLYAPAAIETLTVARVDVTDDLVTVEWSTPVSGDGYDEAAGAEQPTVRAHRLGRTFHLFGYDAPPSFVVARQKTPGDPATTFLTQAVTDYSLHGDGTTGDAISFDLRVDDLQPGATLLVVSTAVGAVRAVPFSVSGVAERRVTRNASVAGGTPVTAQTGRVTQVALTPLDTAIEEGKGLEQLPTGGDIRDITVYELIGEPLRLWPYAYPDTLTSGTVLLPGRRAGWTSLEVGRTVDGGRYRPGTVLDVAELSPGREVLLRDAEGGQPVPATVEGGTLIGSDVAVGPAGADTTTVAALGLDAASALPVTVLLSGQLGTTVGTERLGPRLQLSVRIGGVAVETVTLAAATVGGRTPAELAAALQAAIRGSLSGSPTFAHARAWAVADSIAVVAGIPGDPVECGPSPADGQTVVGLGLDPGRARFTDGVLSRPVTSLPGTRVTGDVEVRVGVDPPAVHHLDVAVVDLPGLAGALAAALELVVTVIDDRLLLLPPVPRHEGRSWLRLSLAPGAPVMLSRGSAELLGNIVPASHGETVRSEILGDGDASRAFQRFTLRKKPVTFVPAAVPGGVATSLLLTVNGVTWREVGSLYAAGPVDQVFTTRLADDGTMTVQFGDGTTGARLPTGRQNVVATYRQGIGEAGRVRAGTLTTLLDRPTGLKSTINPLPSDGGADPEPLDRAREAAPGTVRTFGRAISLRDFEDSALTGGEIAKARSAWVWAGRCRVVHVTVAGHGGATFSPDGLARLAATLDAERDPNHPLLMGNYTPVAVVVAGSVRVDPRYVGEAVRDAARTALLEALSFERREFAAPLHLSDVYSILQDIEGVQAVDIDRLDLKSSDPAFRSAHGVDDSRPQPHARLLMLPARWGGGSGVVLPAELPRIEVPALDVTLRAIGGALP
ncbi:putative baseplate assembly protein [Geodermatophilus sp. URMC 62]|uniref:putative baseplate assembly protein n=1 Tax=Geodermatophilus sp. URMC 62 TaxID=3423414 RepID=UPI00406C7E9D